MIDGGSLAASHSIYEYVAFTDDEQGGCEWMCDTNMGALINHIIGIWNHKQQREWEKERENERCNRNNV